MAKSFRVISFFTGWLALVAVGGLAVAAEDAGASPSTGQVQDAEKEVARLTKLVKEGAGKTDYQKALTHYNNACAYRSGHLYKKAEASFRKALKSSPKDPYIHYNLALLYEDDLKKLKKARKHYLTFVDLTPNPIDAARVREHLLTLALPE